MAATSGAKKRGYDPVAAVAIPGEPLDVTPTKPFADPDNPSMYDPLPPAPPPDPTQHRTVERLAQARAEAARPPILVPPAPAPPPPTGPAFRVRESKVVHLRGSLTTLAKGTVVRESSHDLGSLRAQGVGLDPA